MDDVTPACIMALDRWLRPVSPARGPIVGVLNRDDEEVSVAGRSHELGASPDQPGPANHCALERLQQLE